MGHARGERPAAEDLLVDHELAVVLAERAGGRREAGVGRVRARRPLPDVAVELARAATVTAVGERTERAAVVAALEVAVEERGCARAVLPLELGGQARARPSRERFGLEITDVADRLGSARSSAASLAGEENACQSPSRSSQ